MDEVKQDPNVVLMNGELANYYRRASTLSYHPSMAVRRASVMSDGSSHPHVPDVNELMAAQGGNYNYGYDELVHQQDYSTDPGHGHHYHS